VTTWAERGLSCLVTGSDCTFGQALLALGCLTVVAVIGVWLIQRALRFVLTLRATAVTPPLSRWLSWRVRTLDYSLEEMLRADGARERWISRRRDGIERLSRELTERFARSTAWGNRARDGFSDLRFTDANRVPFPFARMVRERFNLCSVVTASKGPRLLDLDGHWTLDVLIAHRTKVRAFSSPKTFPTQEAAIRGCHAFGRRIIQGRVPYCSIDDLR